VSAIADIKIRGDRGSVLEQVRRTSENPPSIAVVNDIDPSPCPDYNDAAHGTVTSPVDPRLRLPGEWVNCTDYRYRHFGE
jgi:hypothetical protein